MNTIFLLSLISINGFLKMKESQRIFVRQILVQQMFEIRTPNASKNVVSEQSENWFCVKKQVALRIGLFNLSVGLAWKVMTKGRAAKMEESCRSEQQGQPSGWPPTSPCRFQLLEVAWTWHACSGTRSWLGSLIASDSWRIRPSRRWRGIAFPWTCSRGRATAERWTGS